MALVSSSTSPHTIVERVIFSYSVVKALHIMDWNIFTNVKYGFKFSTRLSTKIHVGINVDV